MRKLLLFVCLLLLAGCGKDDDPAWLGFAVGEARVGRVVDLEVESNDVTVARAEVERMCEQLLANPLIESYEIGLPRDDGLPARSRPTACRASRGRERPPRRAGAGAR